MSETPNIVYGRLLESAHISGYGFERMTHELELLLEGDNWRSVGPGFDDVNAFLRSVDLSAFNLGNKKKLHNRIKELQPDASSRAIGKATGTPGRTVREHLSPSGRNRPPKQPDSSPHLQEDNGDGQVRPPEPAASKPRRGSLQQSANKVFAKGTKPTPGEQVQQSTTNDWFTPRKYVDAARNALGGAIDLDPASCAEANKTINADSYCTIRDDGLARTWLGRVWLNPPYGRLAAIFIERLVDEFEAGNVTAAIALVNAHCTDTKWFQRLWDHSLCFTDHRIDFAAGTADRSGSTHGSVFAYLGVDPQAFAREFKQFGAVVRRLP